MAKKITQTKLQLRGLVVMDNQLLRGDYIMINKKLEAFNGYLVENVVYENIQEVREFIEFVVEDWLQFNDSTLKIPVAIKGHFIGYRNEYNAHVGIFTSTDGRLYHIDGGDRLDSVREITGQPRFDTSIIEAYPV